ncbi:MAG: N-acetyl-alpha-D-glucosaminyl L-malate synthase BshA [Balneolales bacterium]
MKIGIVLYPTYGGSGVVATELGKVLASRGHSIHFISYARPMRLDVLHENIFFHEVSMSSYPLFEYPPYVLALAGHLVDIIKYQKLDLIHVHYAIPHATSAWLAKKILGEQGLHIPVVTTLHGTDITIVGSDPSYAPVITFSINQSDGVTAVSDYLKEETYKRFDVNNEIEVIPNFIDLQRFRKTEKSHFKKAICPDGEKVLVHVSNFREVKRVSDTVDIFYKVLQSGIKAHLLLLGDGPDRPKVEAKCRELNICNEVRFLGKQEKVEDILSIADLFLIPSGSETFGLAALEAMSCSVPVISSNIGGLPELNIHGETGYLCELGDTDAMGDYAISILSDDKLHKKLAKNARKRARVFDQNRVIDLYESYYLKVLNR